MDASSRTVSKTLKLASIPKLDKDQFILSFLDTQKLHAKAYVEQGRAFWTTLATSDSANANPTPNSSADKENDYGFSTPILKPRSTKPQLVPKSDSLPLKTSKNTTQISSTPQDPSQNFRSEPSSKNKRASNLKQNEKSQDHQASVASKKRPAKVSDEEEHVARLAERRERKRAKRAIVKAHSDVEGDDSTSDERANVRKKQKSARTDSTKLPALALVHGFSATNVGKNRLTAVPPMLGVFNKGKASVKKQVGSKKVSNKAAIKSSLFSENAFLNKVSGGSKSTSVSTSSHNSDSEASIKPSKTKPVKSAGRARKEPNLLAKDKSHGVSSDEDWTSIVEHTKEDCAIESEVWNIELDGFVLPSDASSAQLSCKESTVILNMKNLSWLKDNATIASCAPKAADQETEGCLDNLSDLSTSHSSLAPSQSASQVPAKSPQLLDSKYFKPRQEPAEQAVAPSEHNQDILFRAPSLNAPVLSCNINEHPQDVTYPEAIDSFDQRRAEEQCDISSRQEIHFSDHSVPEKEIVGTPKRTYQPLNQQSRSNLLWSDTPGFVPPGAFPPLAISKEHNMILFSSGDDVQYTSAFYSNDATFPEDTECLQYAADWVEPPEPTLQLLDAGLHENDYWAPDLPSSVDISQAALAPPDTDMYEDDTSYKPWNGRYEDAWDMGLMEYGTSSFAREQYEPYRTPFSEKHSEEQARDFNDFGTAHLEELGYHYEGERLSQISNQYDYCFEYDRNFDIPLSLNDVDAGDNEESLMEEPYREDVFLQGRELLLGFSGAGNSRFPVNPGMGRMSLVEADVARHLKGHWLPQKL